MPSSLSSPFPYLHISRVLFPVRRSLFESTPQPSSCLWRVVSFHCYYIHHTFEDKFLHRAQPTSEWWKLRVWSKFMKHLSASRNFLRYKNYVNAVANKIFSWFFQFRKGTKLFNYFRRGAAAWHCWDLCVFIASSSEEKNDGKLFYKFWLISEF